MTKKRDDPISQRYRYFRALLRHNHHALGLMADMEQRYYSGRPFTLNQIRISYEELLESVTGLVYCLESMTDKQYPELLRKIEEIDERLFSRFSPSCLIPQKRLTLSLEQIGPEMRALVGSKALNLAILKNQLGLKVPSGFVVTANAFQRFLEHNGLNRFIDGLLSGISPDDYRSIQQASQQIQKRIREGEVPEELLEAIDGAFRQLQEKTAEGVMTAVRSSAVGEDTEATFAGQYDSVLNVGYAALIDAYKTVIASKYSARSINYRLLYGLDDKDSPMAVIVLEMIRAGASGVVYTVDPAIRPHCPIKITSVLGLGEALVSGSTMPDIFLLDRLEDRIVEATIATKDTRVVPLSGEGTALQEVDPADRLRPSIDERLLFKLRQIGLMIEEYFESPQDIEWAVDDRGEVVLLQTRPLNVPKMHPEDTPFDRDIKAEPLLSGGETASTGISAGRVFVFDHLSETYDIEDDIILVSKNASPELARFIGKVKGIVTEVGSASSHLASVAREFGVPAVFGIRNATSVLTNGQYVTVFADKAKVYDGLVEELIKDIVPSRRHIFNSSVHKRMREVLDLISPLTLTDPYSEDFNPSGVKTFHDIIRFTHETSVREIFGIGDRGRQKGNMARRLNTKIPLNFWIIDLSKEAIRDRSPLDPQDIASVPFRAIWQGFIHPGVNWEGTMGLDNSKLSTLFAIGATSELGEQPGGDSYAIVAEDYVNMSLKFAYHFATIDALCGEIDSQNYISLQFSGGAGSYYGKSLRVQFMGNILERLGFKVDIKGDLIEAIYARFDRGSTINALDQLGRLLASCRLLDITIANQDDIDFYTNHFFKGNYDLININRDEALPSFYLKGGLWKAITEEGHTYTMYDGSHSSSGSLRGITNILSKFLGNKHRAFIESLESQHHLPLAVIKGDKFGDCSIECKIKVLGGKTERTGGIVFALKDIENYLAFGFEANEGCLTLYSVLRGRRTVLERKSKKIDTGIWYKLRVEVSGVLMRGLLNNTVMVTHEALEPITGYCGLWAKGDSVLLFDAVVINRS